jgi:predicted TPR repeat methyltransferase
MDYRFPELVARAYASAGGCGPVLDVGAGTGLVGVHLAALGVTPVDGTDIAAEMLDVAKGKGAYRRLFQGDVTARLDVADRAYAGVVSAGTFTLGHVGPQAFDELLRIASPGALFAITISDAHFQAAGFAAKFAALAGRIEGLELTQVRIYGDTAHGDHAADEGKIALFRKV